MSYSEYWNGDPVLAKYYREAEKIKQEKKNQELWLQGLYIYDAVSTVVYNALKPKGAKAQKYTDKPFDLNVNKEKTEEEKKKEIEVEQEKAYAWMESFVKMHSDKKSR